MNASMGYLLGISIGVAGYACLNGGRWRKLLGLFLIAIGLLVALWIDAQQPLVGFAS